MILPKHWINDKKNYPDKIKTFSIKTQFYVIFTSFCILKRIPYFSDRRIFSPNLLFHHFTVHNLSHKVDSMANFPHPRLTISKLNFCLRACQLMIFYSFERPHNESIVFLKSHLKKRYFVAKVHTFWEGHKILQNLHQKFALCCVSQIYSGYFAKFCGLLRIYELYNFLIFYSFERTHIVFLKSYLKNK